MDVHHHTHSPDSYRERKKWTHYLWEFLMLFLVICCTASIRAQPLPDSVLTRYNSANDQKEKGKCSILLFYDDYNFTTSCF